MLNTFVGKCDVCHKNYTVIHTNWTGGGGILENPRCPHCGQSWTGYSFVKPLDVERLGTLVVWSEKPAWSESP